MMSSIVLAWLIVASSMIDTPGRGSRHLSAVGGGHQRRALWRHVVTWSGSSSTDINNAAGLRNGWREHASQVLSPQHAVCLRPAWSSTVL